ncbi:MAG TPA: pilus assembly protein PilM, partial [Coleofasciculaceae cyanobacterium]
MFNRFKDLLSKGKKGIGIELAPERINIAQLRKQGQGYKVSTLYSHEVPEGIFQDGKIIDSPALSELIREALAASKIKVEQVAT